MIDTDNSYPKNLLSKRGRRTVATLLTYFEENVYQHVDKDLQNDIRAKVMMVVGDFQDLAMDMVASETGSINELWVDAIREMHDDLKRRIDGNDSVQARR